MRDHMSVNVSTEPTDEPGPSVGTSNYLSESRKHGRAFIKQLIRQFGEPPGNARLVIKENPHDFGTYLTVDVYFDTDSEEECEYAYKLERKCPAHWDREAREELGLEL